MSMDKIRVGVVGTGSIGRNHARVFSELGAHARFTAIYDTHVATATEMAARFGARACTTLEEFCQHVDAASVATPTPTHVSIARTLLEHGIHVLVEKPIAEDTAGATLLCKMATERGLVLQVGHIERFNPILSALESRLDNPRFIECHRLSPYPARSTEIGVVMDLMIHDIEIILHIVRSPLAHLDAVGVPVLSKGEDIANVRLRFENGCVANLTVSRISPEKMRKIRVFQSNAYLSLDYQKQEGYMYRLADDGAIESSLFRKLLTARDSAIVSEFAGRKIVREPVLIEKAEPLKLELAAFVECARAGARPKVGGGEATAALELALEITRLIESSGAKPTFP